MLVTQCACSWTSAPSLAARVTWSTQPAACGRPRQILLRSPRYVAAKSFDILPTLALETRYFAPFCSGKHIFYPLPVQRFIKSHGRFLNTGFHTCVPGFCKIMLIHSESQWYFGDMISSLAAHQAERGRNGRTSKYQASILPKILIFCSDSAGNFRFLNSSVFCRKNCWQDLSGPSVRQAAPKALTLPTSVCCD